MQIASLNEQVAKLTKTSSTNNLDEAELGEWLRGGSGGHLAPFVHHVKFSELFISGYLSTLAEAQKQCPASRLQCPSSSVAENVPRKADPKATDKLKSASEAGKKAAAATDIVLAQKAFTYWRNSGRSMR